MKKKLNEEETTPEDINIVPDEDIKPDDSVDPEPNDDGDDEDPDGGEEEDPEDPAEPKNEIDDMLIGRIYKKQFAQTKDDIERVLANKIKQRIQQKKKEFVDNARNNM